MSTDVEIISLTAYRHIYKQTDRKTARLAVIQTDRTTYTERQTDKNVDSKHTDRQKDMQTTGGNTGKNGQRTYRQTDIQTEGHAGR